MPPYSATRKGFHQRRKWGGQTLRAQIGGLGLSGGVVGGCWFALSRGGIPGVLKHGFRAKHPFTVVLASSKGPCNNPTKDWGQLPSHRYVAGQGVGRKAAGVGKTLSDAL